MTRSILCGLLAVISVGAMAIVPIACQSGGVGDPCVPEDEYNADFPGFKLEQENIESRSFQCATRICLVNHFQGRVSCPRGQDDGILKRTCNGPTDTSCGKAANGAQIECAASQVIAADCVPCDTKTNPGCVDPCAGTLGSSCDPVLQICVCTQDQTDSFCRQIDDTCKPAAGKPCASVLTTYLCHLPGACQQAGTTTADYALNNGKDCCIPGTDKPISVPVCGQCDAASNRNADQAVYCSCRCCPKCCGDPSLTTGEPCESDKTACGTACDPNFNFCKCPSSYTCSKIRPNVGLGDPNLTGSYCIHEGTDFIDTTHCGSVIGNAAESDNCQGLGTTTLPTGDAGTGDGG